MCALRAENSLCKCMMYRGPQGSRGAAGILMSVRGRREKSGSAEGMVAHERVVGCEYMGIVAVCVWLVAVRLLGTSVRRVPVSPCKVH